MVVRIDFGGEKNKKPFVAIEHRSSTVDEGYY